MADFIAGRQARRTVPYRAVTAYWESHFRWLVDPPTTGIKPGSVGMFSLDRRWQPLNEVDAAKFGIDVTPGQSEKVAASAWYSQKTMEAKAKGKGSHAPVTLRLMRRSRKNAGAVLAVTGGQHARLLYPERAAETLHQLISANPPKWDPGWCLVQEVWTMPRSPGSRVLVGSADTSVSIEGAAGITGVFNGTLSGGRISQVLTGAHEQIPPGCAVMLTCLRIADPWIKRLGKKRVKRPDGSTYHIAKIAYGLSPNQLREVSPAQLLTEVTVAVLDEDLAAAVSEENGTIATIGITAVAIAGAIARRVDRRTLSAHVNEPKFIDSSREQ